MSEEIPGAFPDEPTTAFPVPPELTQTIGDIVGQAQEEDPDQAKKEEDYVRLLFKRIAKAKDQKKKWEENYEVDRSHDYVRGFQRDEADEVDAQGDKRYQINKILSGLKARIPALFYYFPYVRVRPARGREDTPGSQIQARADLIQDTINTIIRQPRTRFKPETMMSLKEAHWSFGVIEVGYEADWGENPYAQKPILIENDDTEQDLEEAGKIQGPVDTDPTTLEGILSKLTQVPHQETFYVKHIPARQFYVSGNDKDAIETQDWVGYWEWIYVKDVKRCESYKNAEEIKATGKGSTEGGIWFDKDLAPISKDDIPKEVPPDMVRIWKIWDQREKKRYVLAEGHNRILKETDYYYLPLSILRFEIMPGEFYPIPPIFCQLTEQDEFNDSREWLRLVRKGTRPRYTYDKSAFPADELEKFETDEFFTMVGVDNNNPDPIRPVQMPQISDAVIRTLALSEAGFAEQAASSPIDRLTRGPGGKPTATEVTAMGEKGNVRDSYEQQEVADWMASICSNIVKVAIEKMTLPQWVVINSDPTSPSFQLESQVIAQLYQQGGKLYQQITADQLQKADDGMQWDITVDVESMSPVTEAQQASKIMQALNMLSAPGVGMLLSLSPPLLKTMLNLIGIRGSTDQQNIFMALKQKMMMEQQMAMAGAGGPPGVAPQPGAPSAHPGAGAGPAQPSKPGGPPGGGPQPAQAGAPGGTPSGAPPKQG